MILFIIGAVVLSYAYLVGVGLIDLKGKGKTKRH